MIVLPIKEKYFLMIKSGIKTEEYREFKEYYHKRFGKFLTGCAFNQETKDDDINYYEFEIVLRNGYSFNSPQMKCDCRLRIGTGKKEWGAIPGKKYYILQILRIKECKNLKEEVNKSEKRN